MQENYDTGAPKKPTNITVNSDLLRIAKELKINISATLEEALAEQVKIRKKQAWMEENREAMHTYNEFIEQNGLFSDHVKKF